LGLDRRPSKMAKSNADKTPKPTRNRRSQQPDPIAEAPTETKEPDEKSLLTMYTQRIKERENKNKKDKIETGLDLIEMRKLKTLPHGRFIKWIKLHFEMGLKTAERYMKMAEHFGDKIDTVSNLGLSVCYELCELTDEDREKFVARAKAGEKVTRKEVREFRKPKIPSITKKSDDDRYLDYLKGIKAQGDRDRQQLAFQLAWDATPDDIRQSVIERSRESVAKAA
jgi:hypothetical protein